MNADVSLHVLRADAQDLLGVDTLRVGPLRDDVVDDPLAQGLGYFVEQHELFDRVQHLVVLGRAVRVVVNDGGDVAEDGGVQEGGDDHHATAEGLLVVGGGGHVAEPDRSHASHREVERCHVHAGEQSKVNWKTEELKNRETESV
jgi:hypothetical protein